MAVDAGMAETKRLALIDHLISDLEQQARVRPRRRGADERAQGACQSPLASDHLADVVLGDVEPEDDGVLPLDPLDPNLVRLVHELARDPLEQLVHCLYRSAVESKWK